MYLTLRLLEEKLLNKDSTIVIVSSDLHKRGVKQTYEYFENLNTRNYHGMDVYAQTKLFNLLFANYLLNIYLPKIL